MSIAVLFSLGHKILDINLALLALFDMFARFLSRQAEGLTIRF